ncbi:hypothetical protein IQ07DRAFT_674538 [Pyrenochaeta sp. DS3sAY3a]|nr:hypothetical protein IQ07DRAFT_674538 [Pyrenochaeta sp. DS3sAY3a]
MPARIQPSTEVEVLLQDLTIQEKVSLLSGVDGWQTTEISRLGIGSIKTTDGPVGARGNQIVDGPRALFLPATVLLASTWSRADIRQIGRLLSREAKTKGAQILLAPTVCCARNPLGGRNFETFSEDPFLSGILAVEYVGGVQESREVVATAKHFVANEQEYHRFTVNANINEKALREIYLKPFEMLAKCADPPGCFMTAYNCVNGTHMDSNSFLVDKVLRQIWGYEGLIMSDWGGTNSTIESVLAGCDLEMPGPAVFRGTKLLQALKRSKTPDLETAVDSSCRRILTLAKDLGLLGLSESEAKATRCREEYSATSREDIETVRQVAASGAVLLKNSASTLPLLPHHLHNKKVAFIGPNSKRCAPGGGGSASMNPQYLSQPMEAFKAIAAELEIAVEVAHSPGAYSRKWLPLISPEQWSLPSEFASSNGHGDATMRVDFFSSIDLTGPVFETQYRTSSYVDLFDTAPAALLGRPYSFRITLALTPSTTGLHALGISSVGNAKLFVDGALVINNDDWTSTGETFYAFGSVENVQTISLNASQRYKVTLECSTKSRPAATEIATSHDTDVDSLHVFASQAGVRLGYLEQLPDSLAQDAIDLSNKSDYTIMVLGLDDEWESEGYDRQDMALPASQNSLVWALLEQSTRPESIIIVNQSGAPVEMPWADDLRVATILQVWYGGQEAGNALADLLLGTTTPSGRLPVTWPKLYQDLHFTGREDVWPGRNDNVWYEEGSDVGYRWFLKNGTEPQWWFGFGLTYTKFNVGNFILGQGAGKDLEWQVTMEVENIGEREGDEVLQAYLWPFEDPASRILVGFEKSRTLLPGEKEDMVITINMRDGARWHDGQWLLTADTYNITIARSSSEVDFIFTQEVVIGTNLTWEP